MSRLASNTLSTLRSRWVPPTFTATGIRGVVGAGVGARLEPTTRIETPAQAMITRRREICPTSFGARSRRRSSQPATTSISTSSARAVWMITLCATLSAMPVIASSGSAYRAAYADRVSLLNSDVPATVPLTPPIATVTPIGATGLGTYALPSGPRSISMLDVKSVVMVARWGPR